MTERRDWARLLTDLTGAVDITCVWKLNGLVAGLPGGIVPLCSSEDMVDCGRRRAVDGVRLEDDAAELARYSGVGKSFGSVSSTTNVGRESLEERFSMGGCMVLSVAPAGIDWVKGSCDVKESVRYLLLGSEW